MDKIRIFQALADEETPILLELLSQAYDVMDIERRREVFAAYVTTLPPEPVDGEFLLDEIEAFKDSSLAGFYYAPFGINSKNYRYIPEETKEWFEELGDYLKTSQQLTMQEDHLHAVACFNVLFELIGRMEAGEEIIFAEEYGSWMIPADEKEYLMAYLTSLAAIANPDEFVEAAISFILQDSRQSFYAQAYASAIRAANDEQRELLEAEVQRREIPTSRST